jgi:hypothetical protein
MDFFRQVMATFKLTSIPAPKPPKYCTKYFIEFSGKQQKLSAFFTQQSQSENVGNSSTNEKRKQVQTGSEQQAKRVKSEQPQKNLYSFFKPRDPPNCKEIENGRIREAAKEEIPPPMYKVEEIDPEKRVQVQIMFI